MGSFLRVTKLATNAVLLRGFSDSKFRLSYSTVSGLPNLKPGLRHAEERKVRLRRFSKLFRFHKISQYNIAAMINFAA